MDQVAFSTKAAERLAAKTRAEREEFVVLFVEHLSVRIIGDSDNVLAVFEGVTADDAEKIITIFKSQRVASRLKTTKLVDCDICGSFHPTFFSGDCRDDGNRFPVPDDPDDEAEEFDEN